MTIKQIQRERLQKYIDAEDAILNGAQSYQIGQRTLTRADLSEIRKVISDLIDSGVTLEDEPIAGRTRRVVFIE